MSSIAPSPEDSVEDDPRPCRGRNSNVCVAEGCYGMACVDLWAGVNGGPGDTSFPPSGADDAPNEPKGAVSKVAVPAPARITPPRTNGCWDCGRLWSEPGWVDIWIPDEWWQRIAPIPSMGTDGSGYLCVHCIAAALNDIGARDVPIEVWGGPFLRWPDGSSD